MERKSQSINPYQLVNDQAGLLKKNYSPNQLRYLIDEELECLLRIAYGYGYLKLTNLYQQMINYQRAKVLYFLD